MRNALRVATMLAGIGALAWAAGCGGSEADEAGWAGEVIDSAGVRVVVNRGDGAWAEGSPILEEELRLGSVGGGGPDEFGDVIALDVDMTGRMYVLDQQARQVRVFDADGAHVRTLGGPGEGPGELSRLLMGLFVSPDGTVSVPDVGNARVTRLGIDGVSFSSGSWRSTTKARLRVFSTVSVSA